MRRRHIPWVLGLALWVFGCPKDDPDKQLCMFGFAEPTGQWSGLKGQLDGGKACKIHDNSRFEVAYRNRSSDSLMNHWASVVSKTFTKLKLDGKWGARENYRTDVYREKPPARKALTVDIVETSGTNIRTVRLYWNEP